MATSFLEEWIDGATIHQSGADEGGVSQGFAWNLHDHIISVFSTILPLIRERFPEISKDELASLTASLGNLILWGEGYQDGRLESVMEESRDMKAMITAALSSIGRVLTTIVPQIATAPGLIDLSISNPAYDDALRAIAEKLRLMLENLIESDSESDSETEDEEDKNPEYMQISHIVSTLETYTECLMDLLPSMESTLGCSQAVKEDHSEAPAEFHVSGPARTYIINISDQFDKADIRLVERLGEANWQRHTAIRNSLEAQVEEEETPKSIFRPVSLFQDSALGSSMPAQSSYAATMVSHSSFVSSLADAENGRLRVPKTPSQVFQGIPFDCEICGHKLCKIKNRVDWKRHVFADLKPYICTFSGCKEELSTFPTRKIWEQHEFGYHRIDHFWKCSDCKERFSIVEDWRKHLQVNHNTTFSDSQFQIAPTMAEQKQKQAAEIQTCPLCLCTPGKSQRNFVAHVGKHMEAIALAALPRDNHSDSDSEMKSETSTLDQNIPDDFSPGNVYVPQHEIPNLDLGNLAALRRSCELVNPDDDEVNAENEASIEDVDEDEPRYCYCNRVAFGKMIGCEADNCEREWFHFKCVGLKVTTRRDGPWYCDECRNKMKEGHAANIRAKNHQGLTGSKSQAAQAEFLRVYQDTLSNNAKTPGTPSLNTGGPNADPSSTSGAGTPNSSGMPRTDRGNPIDPDEALTRARTLLGLFEKRGQFKQMGDQGLLRSKERVDAVAARYAKRNMEALASVADSLRSFVPPSMLSSKSTDTVTQMLAKRAATDPELKTLMRLVANGDASSDELKRFQIVADEFIKLYRDQEASAQAEKQPEKEQLVQSQTGEISKPPLESPKQRNQGQQRQPAQWKTRPSQREQEEQEEQEQEKRKEREEQEQTSREWQEQLEQHEQEQIQQIEQEFHEEQEEWEKREEQEERGLEWQDGLERHEQEQLRQREQELHEELRGREHSIPPKPPYITSDEQLGEASQRGSQNMNSRHHEDSITGGNDPSSYNQEAEDDEATMRSMARRKRSASIAELAPKRCPEAGCDKEFKRACDLTKHEKTHSRPWKCSVDICLYHEYGWPTEKERDRHHNHTHAKREIPVSADLEEWTKQNFTETGCITCRRRNEKCDENKPECDKCRRHDFVCLGYLQGGSGISSGVSYRDDPSMDM